MPNDTPLHIEVAYAEPGKQRLLAFQVASCTGKYEHNAPNQTHPAGRHTGSNPYLPQPQCPCSK